MAVKRPSANIPAAAPPSARRRPGGGGGGDNTPFVQAMIAAWSIPELRRRLMFVFAMFGVYIFGLHIPAAGRQPCRAETTTSTIGVGAAS